MNKRILYSLLGLALIFFIGSLIIFFNSKKSSQEPKISKPEVTEVVPEVKEDSELMVKLFFLTERSWFMRPVSCRLKVPATRLDLYKEFINRLLKGSEKYIVPVPDGVRLRTLYFIPDNSLLILDFNEQLLSNFPSGSRRELEFIYFIVNNVCYNFKEVKKVKFIISGNEYKFLTGHLDIENPFYPDFSYLRDE